MIKQRWQKNIIITLLFSTIIFYFWKSGIIYSYSLYPIVKEGRLHIFADWAYIIKNTICNNLGFDIFKSHDACPLFGKDNVIFNKGNILLYIPYFKSLEKFYFFYFPITTGIFFIFSVVSLIKPKKFVEYFLLILIIFSPPTLLVIERSNEDILIFLFIYIIAYVNLSSLNFIIITILSLAKWYPLTLMINFVIEKERTIKHIIIIILFFIFSFAFIAYLTSENIQSINYKLKSYIPSWGNQFSVRSFALITNKITDHGSNLILYTSYVFFVFFTTIFVKIFKKTNFVNDLNIINFEERLFILGSNLIVLLYLITDNIHYREVFIIFLLPLIVKIRYLFENKIFKYLLYFIIYRYIFFIIANYLVFFKKTYLLLYIKAFSDIILISSFAAMCLIMNIEILKKLIKYEKTF